MLRFKRPDRSVTNKPCLLAGVTNVLAEEEESFMPDAEVRTSGPKLKRKDKGSELYGNYWTSKVFVMGLHLLHLKY